MLFESRKNWRCAGCGMENTPNMRFCEYCGSEKTVAPTRPTCPSCGVELPKGKLKFCRRCGQPLDKSGQPAGEIQCPHCGKANGADKKFCRHCGKPLTEQELAAEPAAEPVAEIQCPHCGKPNGSDKKFCRHCGKPLTEQEPKAEEPAAVDEEPVEEIDISEEGIDEEPVEEINISEDIIDEEPVEEIDISEEVIDEEPVEEIDISEAIIDEEPVEEIDIFEEVIDEEPVEEIDISEEVIEEEPVEDDFEEKLLLSGADIIIPEICPECGMGNPLDLVFCAYCGLRLIPFEKKEDEYL